MLAGDDESMTAALCLATSADAGQVARLLHDFNTEFGSPTPGVQTLGSRIEALLAKPTLFVVLSGEPVDGLAVVSLRPNVWFDGPVALLDELYVVPDRRSQGVGSDILAFARSEARARGSEYMEINVDAPDTDARRFYERHGFTATDPDTGDTALYYSCSL